jgi:hypothetical protein
VGLPCPHLDNPLRPKYRPLQLGDLKRLRFLIVTQRVAAERGRIGQVSEPQSMIVLWSRRGSVIGTKRQFAAAQRCVSCQRKFDVRPLRPRQTASHPFSLIRCRSNGIL